MTNDVVLQKFDCARNLNMLITAMMLAASAPSPPFLLPPAAALLRPGRCGASGLAVGIQLPAVAGGQAAFLPEVLVSLLLSNSRWALWCL